MGILIVILIIFAAYLFLKNLPIIAITIVGSILLILVGNYVVKDMLHLDADKYVDTSSIENLENKILLKSGEKIAQEEKQKKEYYEGELSTKSPEYIACVEKNLVILDENSTDKVKELVDCNSKYVNTSDASKKNNSENQANDIEEVPKNKNKTIKADTSKAKNRTHTYKYKFSDYDTEEKLLEIVATHKTIEDTNFERKILGLNPYVDIEYDLGIAILSVRDNDGYIHLVYK